ncbi:MAG: methyltransferase type 11, partial [Planctomycetes bacterium SCN 63-9]
MSANANAGATAEAQRQRILDQFTRQARPFREMGAHSEEASMRLVLEASGVGANDTVLDVACGPGLTACAFARMAHHVTGIDLTPAMIEQARLQQQSQGLENLAWEVGDSTALPFPDNAFSIVFSRYAFHHLLEPSAALAEMVRVCKPGGRVVVVDVYTTTPEQARAYNAAEKLRDPSHTRALDLAELLGMMRDDARLGDLSTEFYGLDVDFETLLASSFPDPENL